MQEDEVNRLNVLLGKQVHEIIRTLFGTKSRPFVMILPGAEDESSGAMVGNIEGKELARVLREALSHANDAGVFYPNDSKASVS